MAVSSRFEHLVVVGASSGGLEALTQLARDLPRAFPAPVCVVLHTAPDSPGVLHRVLERAGPLRAETARTGQRLEAGRIYVAAPDHHLLVEPGTLRLSRGPKENRFRPAIDPLFRSAAQVYGPRVIGVLLTGNLDDGTAGLWTIKQLGGIAVVQDPHDAVFSSMPASALRHVAVDHCVPLADLPGLLVRITSTPVHARQADAALPVEVEVEIAKGHDAIGAGIQRIGSPSEFACPECHGVLRELKEGDRVRFRCHTGHAYSAESLVSAVNAGIEDALWNAIRALEEGGRMMRRFAAHLEAQHGADAAAVAGEADRYLRGAGTVREVAVARGRSEDAAEG